MALFRKEALEHQRSRIRGELVVSHPLSHYALTGLIVAVVVAVVAYLAWGSYRRQQVVRGYLVPEKGIAKVFGPRDSTIVERHVTEGQRVNKGDVLFTLTTGRIGAQGQRVDEAVVAALDEQRVLIESGLERTQRKGELSRSRLEARARHIREELVRLDELAVLRRKQVELGREALEAVKSMDAHGFGVISLDELRSRRAALLEKTLQLGELELSLAVKKAELETVDLELASQPVAQGQERDLLRRSLADLKARRTSQSADRAFSVLAPTGGAVSALQASVGQFIALSTPLCAIVPFDSPLQARVFVPTRAAGWVDPGQLVRLTYDAFPREHYGAHEGEVVSVAQTILNPRELDSPLALQEPTYAATLSLSSQWIEAFGKTYALQPGMLLTGHVLLEERSLLRWLLRPLYTLR